MIFQHTLDKVLSGEKFQTRRLVKAGEDYYLNDSEAVKAYETPDEFPRITLPERIAWQNIATVLDASGRRKWEVGKDYAIQPARGQKSVGRIRITGLRREDVRTISDTDVLAEGFESRNQFLAAWCNMHDKPARDTVSVMSWVILSETSLRNPLEFRPAHLYDAWVITFKVVE